MFHILIWGGLELCLGGLSPPKPPRDDEAALTHKLNISVNIKLSKFRSQNCWRRTSPHRLRRYIFPRL